MSKSQFLVRRDSGQAILPLILVLTGVLGLIGVTFAGITFLQSTLSAQRAFAERAYQAAESGVDDALLRLARNGSYTSAGYTVDVNGVTADVSVSDTPGASGCSTMLTCRTIDSEAAVRGVTRTMQAVVEVTASGGTRVLIREEVAM